MMMKGERLELLAFLPHFIYNSYFWVCQEQVVFSACLTDMAAFYSGNRPSYMILSSPYTCAQFRIVDVHFFVASKVDRYSAFHKTISLGNMLLWHFLTSCGAKVDLRSCGTSISMEL